MSLIDILSKGLITWNESDVMFYIGAFITLVIGYLLGSFDIRHFDKFSDGSKLARFLSIVVDAIEGILAVGIGMVLMPGDGFSYVAVLGAMIGHVYPLYFGFKGSSCIFVFGFAALILNPIAALFSLVISIAVLLFSKYMSGAYIAMSAVFPIINFYIPFSMFTMQTTTVMEMINYLLRLMVPILMTIMVLIAHINNIKNMINGTEEKYNPKY
ncbi:MAG: glycerol-3-phosphate acyltransferase [Clostridia bacterium]|nr:glycerol-3-phosphate acyltransferase [Clostridia bacterium]